MRVVAVANRKGGTGKTTTAVNLAAEWARRGLRTLIVDLDSQGHASIGVGGGEPVKGAPTIHDLFRAGRIELANLIQPTPNDNLWLIAADSEFDGLQLEVDTGVLRDALRVPAIEQRFDRVILDTPPTLDVVLISALIAADGVIVPFIPHHLAEVGVKQLARLFYRIATRHNPDLKLVGLIPIMLDKRVKMHQKVLDTLTRQFGKQRILRGIRSNIRLAEAFSEGQPVSNYAARCAGAMDYYLLAEELEALSN